MNVFISWSGDRSKKVATLLDEWLQCVIQKIKPWMSSKDIDRGALWFTEINDQLQTTSIGIICLTKENLNKPWILFESGALLKGLSSNRVCTLLIDLEPADIIDPLAQFNHTIPTRDGLWSLVRTLNNTLIEDRLSEKILERIFETYWPQFEENFKVIISETVEGDKPRKKNDNEILYEILNSLRVFDKRLRSLEYDSKENKFEYMNSAKLEKAIIDIINNYGPKIRKNDNPVQFVTDILLNNYNFIDKNVINNNYDYKSLENIIANYINKYI